MSALHSKLSVFAAKANKSERRLPLLHAAQSWLFGEGREIFGTARAVFAGGSIAKGTSCESSDADLCVVTDDQQRLSFFSSPSETQRRLPNAHGIAAARFRQGNTPIDVRFIRVEAVLNLIDNFQRASDVSLRTQDFLWNMRFGIYLKGDLEDLKCKLDASYANSLQTPPQKRISTRLGEICVSLIDDIGRTPTDYLDRLEMGIRLEKTFLLLALFQLNEGFWGFKNTSLIRSAIPKICSDGIISARQWTSEPDNNRSEVVRIISESKTMILGGRGV